MTNEQAGQGGATAMIPREISAAEPRDFNDIRSFEGWLERWEANSDESVAMGLLHVLFGATVRDEIDRRLRFMIVLLKPLDFYGKEHEAWERIQRKAAAVVVANLFKKRDHDLDSVGLMTMRNYPELASGFLKTLMAPQKGFDRPKFFFHDDRDSSEKLIQSFLAECHQILRGIQPAGRRLNESRALREVLSNEREALYRLFLEHKLANLCGADNAGFSGFDAINDPRKDLVALKAIALAHGWNGVPQTIPDVLAEAGTFRSLRQEAAIQYRIIESIFGACRRARRLANRTSADRR